MCFLSSGLTVVVVFLCFVMSGLGSEFTTLSGEFAQEEEKSCDADPNGEGCMTSSINPGEMVYDIEREHIMKSHIAKFM